ncbi:MAG: DUF6933 domain-containing protein [Planctomycetota bacterium]|jgi:hypothetical protein
MIFRLTRKMAKKIHVAPLSRLPLDDNPFADWCAHLFRAERTQYIILTNTRSLYSMLIFGSGITDDDRFLKTAIGHVRDVLTADGFESVFDRFVAPATGLVRFATVGDRRVLGSMNDLVANARFYLAERGLSQHEASFHLNEMPMSLLGMRSPREAFAALADV